MNGATDREFTVYYIKVANSHLRLAFDILVDMLRKSIFDPVEVEKERRSSLKSWRWWQTALRSWRRSGLTPCSGRTVRSGGT